MYNTTVCKRCMHVNWRRPFQRILNYAITDLPCQSSPSLFRPPNLWYEERDVTEKMKCQQVKYLPLMIIVKTWLYCNFYNGMKDRINPAFRWQRRVLEQCVCVCVCEQLCVWTRVREGGDARKRRQTAEDGQSPEARTLYHHPTHLVLQDCSGSSPRLSTAGSVASLRPASSPGPALSRKPLYRSLLILPKHVVLFALHVLKVKVAPGHTFVDVLDVIARGLKVSGGVIGPWGEDLGMNK